MPVPLRGRAWIPSRSFTRIPYQDSKGRPAKLFLEVCRAGRFACSAHPGRRKPRYRAVRSNPARRQGRFHRTLPPVNSRTRSSKPLASWNWQPPDGMCLVQLVHLCHVRSSRKARTGSDPVHMQARQKSTLCCPKMAIEMERRHKALTW